MNRKEIITKLYPNLPAFRLKQIETALFDCKIGSWQEVSTLAKNFKEDLSKELLYYSYLNSKVFQSKIDDTYKALLEFLDGEKIETVLMKNTKDAWTICVSSQVGCSIGCTFCATGKMGLRRNLSDDEIVDQYRFWDRFIFDKNLDGRISNIVFMGMGEPILNYENVKNAINTILRNTNLGINNITVSTVGVLPMMEKILIDPEWPQVLLAISLHSADRKVRKQIIDYSSDDFLIKLKDWAKRYLEKYGNKRRHLTFEYIVLNNINDTEEAARQLTNYVNSIGNSMVNLIPYNYTDEKYDKTDEKRMLEFQSFLIKHGVHVFIRKSMGSDIAAACGQLVNS